MAAVIGDTVGCETDDAERRRRYKSYKGYSVTKVRSHALSATATKCNSCNFVTFVTPALANERPCNRIRHEFSLAGQHVMPVHSPEQSQLLKFTSFVRPLA